MEEVIQLTIKRYNELLYKERELTLLKKAISKESGYTLIDDIKKVFCEKSGGVANE